jgi:hypothetical protein
MREDERVQDAVQKANLEHRLSMLERAQEAERVRKQQTEARVKWAVGSGILYLLSQMFPTWAEFFKGLGK